MKLPNDYLNGQKILIIEDDEVVANIYRRNFEAAGFDVHVELDGSEGYYQIFRVKPDAVLLDLLLPGMDGPSIIRKFRAQKRFADLPILVFTNAYLSEIGRDAIRAGATQVFNKATVGPKEMIDAVVNSLNKNIEEAAAAAHTPSQPGKEESTERVSEKQELDIEASVAPEFLAPMPAVKKPVKSSGRAESTRPDSNHTSRPQKNVMEAPAARPPQTDADPNFEFGHVMAVLSNDQKELLRNSGSRIYNMWSILRSLTVPAKQQPPDGEGFLEMSHLAHSISGHAAIVGLHYLAHFTAALEALTRELYECPARFGASTRAVLAKALDILARLVNCGTSCELKEFSRLNVLVVDNDKLSRTLIIKTLDWNNLSHVETGHAETALELLQENQFDLVLLDVELEGMSGFELCKALRNMSHYLHCPVIFVSSQSDLHSKIAALQSGGNDLIAKPFTPMELGLKELLFIISSQLEKNTPPRAGRAAPPFKNPGKL